MDRGEQGRSSIERMNGESEHPSGTEKIERSKCMHWVGAQKAEENAEGYSSLRAPRCHATSC